MYAPRVVLCDQVPRAVQILRQKDEEINDSDAREGAESG